MSLASVESVAELAFKFMLCIISTYFLLLNFFQVEFMSLTSVESGAELALKFMFYHLNLYLAFAFIFRLNLCLLRVLRVVQN